MGAGWTSLAWYYFHSPILFALQLDLWFIIYFSAPLHYPVHIEVHPQGDSSVKVQFRGVSTGVWEEPLLGYKVSDYTLIALCTFCTCFFISSDLHRRIHISGLQIRVRIGKLFSLFLVQNICCGYPKEPSQWDGSFEHPKHMFKLMGKKIIKNLRK